MSYAQSLLVGLPLAGFLLNGLAGNRLGKRFVSIVGCGLPIVAFGVALQCLADLTARGGTPLVETAYAWTVIGGRSFEIALAIPIVLLLVRDKHTLDIGAYSELRG